MRDFSLSRQADQPLFFASAIADMLASESVEQLLRIFLTEVGEKLNVDRVAVCRAIAPQQLKVLVEAISSDCQAIKNNIYPIQYFGVDSFISFPRDRAITFADTSEITETLSIHHQWQSTLVRGMISAPILFDCPDSESQSYVWGIAIGQCQHPQQWQPEETAGFWEITQALGECLQYWSLLMRSAKMRSLNHNPQSTYHHQFSATIPNSCDFVPNMQLIELDDLDDMDELQCTRVVISDEMLANADAMATEIAIINSFGLIENPEIANQNGALSTSDNILNQGINRAMQRLEQYFDQQSVGMENEAIDAESKTEEDILENITQPHYGSAEEKVKYLQQKVIVLIDDLQQKAHEIVTLRSQLQQLVKSQDEFRQILDVLQSENLSQSAQKAVTEISNILQSSSNRNIF